MADQGGMRTLLTQKWGPAPVWVWAGGTLVILWVVMKYRDMKKSAADQEQQQEGTPGGDYAAEGEGIAPQFVIMNNLPASGSAPGTATPGPAPAPSRGVSDPTGHVLMPPGSALPVVSKPPATRPPGAKPALSYKLQHGDTLAKVAARHHVKGGASALWAYNITPGNRPAAVITVLRRRGPNGLSPGETILIPQ